MIGQRQIGFRQEYRSRILGWYHGYVHVVIIYAMGVAAFYVYIGHLHAISALEWLTVPLTLSFHQCVRVGGPPIHHAPAGQYQRPARDL
jgi:hypothetical protein